MKILHLPLVILLFGCSAPTNSVPGEKFFVSAVYQALWFDAENPKTAYPTGVKSVDEILAQVPPERRQAILAEALQAWRTNKNATANIQ